MVLLSFGMIKLCKKGRSVGFRRCAVTLPGAGGAAATLRRCHAARGWGRCDATTLPYWASDAALLLTLLTLRGYDAAKPERRCWRCDGATLRRCNAGSALRRCWRCDAATLRGGYDAATLLALRRFLLE